MINARIPLTKESYEEKLYSKDDPYEYKFPDFTFKHKGKEYYWGYFRMLAVESYRRSTDAKLKWYEDNGYTPNLIISPEWFRWKCKISRN